MGRRAILPLLLSVACAWVAGCSRSQGSQATPTPGPAGTATATPAYSGPPPRVIVVGGGLAGLVSAYELQKRGVVSHVLEATDTLGGRLNTMEYGDGLTAEAGLQELWEDNPLVAIAKELSVPMEGSSKPAWSSQVVDGKVRPYVQDTPKEFFRSLLASDAELAQLEDWLAKTKVLHDAAVAKGLADPAVRKLQDVSFKTWLTEAKLPKNAEDLVRRTIECELGTEWTNFSAAVGVLEYGVFLGEGVPNHHVKGGNLRLVEALAKSLKGPVTLNALVTRVERTRVASGKITVRVTYLKDHEPVTVEAERVVVAVPFWRLHQILFEPALSEDKWDAIITLQRAQYTVVHMVMPKAARKAWEQPGGETPFAILSDGPLGVIYGVQETSEESPNDIFSLLVYGQPAASWHMQPRELKLAEVRRELDKLWPGLSAHIRDTHVYTYHPASLPVWPPGRSPMDAQAAKLREPETGLYLAGDYLYNAHSDGAARAGISAGERIAAELGGR